jgi:hypothetical protein
MLTSSRTAPVDIGATLTFETLTDDAPLRVRPGEDTLLRVVSGVVYLRFDGEARRLEAGGEAIVPAGFHHTLCAPEGDARIVMGFAPRRPEGGSGIRA